MLLLPAPAKVEAPPEPPALPFDKAIDADDALAIGRQLGAITDPQARKALLEQRDDKGCSAVLRAAFARKLSAAAMLAYCGADLAINAKVGANALFAGLVNNDTRFTEVLLSRPELASLAHDGVWFPPARLAELLSTLGAHSTSADVDQMTSELTWNKVEGLRDGTNVQKYWTHTRAMTKNPLGVDAEVWTTYNFLLSRTRTLVEMYAKDAAPGRAPLLRELSSTLETLRLERRVWHVWDHCNEKQARALFAHEAESILRRLDGRMSRDAYVIPSGWKGSPSGHALCTSIENIERDGMRMTRIWIDNLGEGRSAHIMKDNRVYPLAVDVPSTPATRDLLRNFVAGCLFNRGNGNDKQFYDRFSVLSAKLIVDFGPVVLVDTTQLAQAHDRQTASNCTFANAVPGLTRRLGELAAEQLLTAERDIARRHVIEMMQPDVLDTAVAQNEDRVAKELGREPVTTAGAGKQ